MAFEEEIEPLLTREDDLPAANAAREERRHFLEAVSARWEAVDHEILRLARIPTATVHAAEAVLVE
jgi:hypothetical protein